MRILAIETSSSTLSVAVNIDGKTVCEYFYNAGMIHSEVLISVIDENDYDVEYIRCSREPLFVFLSAPDLYTRYRPVNAVKNIILAMYAGKIDRYCKEKGLNKMYLWGLLMSGRMDYPRIDRLKGAMEKKAQAAGRDLEILFHPGRALPGEINEEINRAAADEFYLSKNRTVEKEAVLKLR